MEMENAENGVEAPKEEAKEGETKVETPADI